MSITHLPDRALSVVGRQGWSPDNVIVHLLGFIGAQFPGSGDWGEELANYFDAAATEENGEPPADSPVFFTARFIPQAWINKYAVTTDDDQPEFPITAQDLMDVGQDPRDYEDLQTLHDTLYDMGEPRDDLRNAAAAPRWVKDWGGPFEIELEFAPVSEDLFEFRPADDAAIEDDQWDLKHNRGISIQVSELVPSVRAYLVNEIGFKDPEARTGFWFEEHGEFDDLQDAFRHALLVDWKSRSRDAHE